MFRQLVSPFVCILLCLVVCVLTFVGTAAYTSQREEQRLNEMREEWSQYAKYNIFNDLSDEELKNVDKLFKLIELLEDDSIREFDREHIWEMIYKSLAIGTNDIYGQYLTAEEYAATKESTSGHFVGIGVRVIYDEVSNGAYIYGVITDSGASKAGLQKGDIIIEAEGVKSTDQESYLEMVNSILGEADTNVQIKVKRGDKTLDFTITRAQVLSENVLYEKLAGDIAYIQILTFSDGSLPYQVKAKMEMAQEDGCTSYIFDVRNNTGGLLESITGVLDPLLPEGPIINTVDKYGNKETISSDADCFKAPMVVLCNKSTASAAELFTAALRDYDMATIVGETTYGKGSMQTTKLLSDGSAIKMTTALYTPPSGESYDGIGIVPDVEVKLDEEWVNKFQIMPRERDHQLKKAIEILNSAN